MKKFHIPPSVSGLVSDDSRPDIWPGDVEVGEAAICIRDGHRWVELFTSIRCDVCGVRQ